MVDMLFTNDSMRRFGDQLAQAGAGRNDFLEVVHFGLLLVSFGALAEMQSGGPAWRGECETSMATYEVCPTTAFLR
jgi:hypothetical protein